MNIPSIKEGATIIAPTYLHTRIRRSLLLHKNALANVRVCSLDTYLSPTLAVRDESVFAYYQTLKELRDTLEYNKDSVTTLSYIQEVKACIEDMKRYGISPQSLPCTHPVQEENKRIIEALFPLLTNVEEQQLQAGIKGEKRDFSDTYIIDDSGSLYVESMYQLWMARGAHRVHELSNVQHKHWYSALNRRQEVESAAQFIIEHNLHAEDIKISALSPAYIHEIKHVFARYKIPFHVVVDSYKNDILQRFVCLLQYYLTPHTKALESLFLQRVFTHPHQADFLAYLALHKKNIHDDFHTMDELHISHTILSSQEIEALTRMETNARAIKDEIEPILTHLSSLEDSMDVLTWIDDYLCAHATFHNSEDRATLLRIRECIKIGDQYIGDSDDLAFFMSLIDAQKTPIKSDEKGCAISDGAHPLGHTPYHIMLGCTQTLFPAFVAKSGLFDEAYYAQLPYPSIEERYAFHVKKQHDNVQSCTTLICFTPLSTLDGKGCESSLEMDTYMGSSPTPYPLKNTYKPHQRNYALTPQNALQLFLKVNSLHGSISSLERYMSCPYSYFLRYGLRLKEPVDYTFNSAKSGLLSHYILECLVARHGKQYVDASRDEVRDILDTHMQELTQVYPHDDALLAQIQQRLLHNIILHLDVLKEHEAHSSLSPTACEHRFEYPFSIDEKRTIVLHGVVDRVDTNDDFLRVIDYKSSPHQLKEEKVFAALQLQLMTYLIVVEKEFEKRPLGAFYYSLATSNTKAIYGTLQKRPLAFVALEEHDRRRAFLKEGRLNGWLFEEHIEAMDDDGRHIVGVRNSKASGINASTIYDFATMKSYVEQLYRIVGTRILEGRIECEHTQDACLHCPFPAVCGKAAYSSAKEELLCVESALYKKGGRSDDTME